MSFKFLIFLFGFGLTVIGLSYIIIYLNLLGIIFLNMLTLLLDV